MKRIFYTAACLSLLTLPSWASARNPVAVPSGFKPGSMKSLHSALRETPKSPTLNTQMGVGMASRGRFLEASVYLEWGEQASLSELQASADTLRNLGQPEQAHRLRGQALLLPISGSDQVALLLSMAQDARSAGDTDQAWRDAQRALSIQPRAKSVHALLAEVALDWRDVALAEEHIFLSQHRTPGVLPIQLLQVRARLAILQGDLHQARIYVDRARKQRRWAPHSVALDAQLCVAEGDPHLALERLERPALGNRQDLELLATKALVLEELGLDSEAQSYRDLLTSLQAH